MTDKARWARMTPGQRKKANATVRKWQKANPKQTREYYVKWRYGLSAEDYAKLILAQDAKCAICQVSFSEKRPNVDHNHSTGQVRGLLCSRCNTALGISNDDPELMKKMVEYLIQWTQN